MDYFVNFEPSVGVTIDTYRNPNARFSGDIVELAYDVEHGRHGSCPLEGSLDALEDGSVWGESIATQETLELLHSAILLFEKRK